MGFLQTLFAGSALSDPDHFLFSASAPMTPAGTQVNEHLALNLPVVYSAVGLLADSVSQLPIDVVQKIGGRRAVVEDHPVSNLLNARANPDMSAMIVRQTVQSQSLLWGNGFMEIQRNNGGDPVGLFPLKADNTRNLPKEGDPTGRSRVYRTTIGTKQIDLPPERVAHIPALGYDGYNGYSPVFLARNAIGLSSALEEFGSRFFGNDAKSGGFIKHPSKLGIEAQTRIRESFEAQGGLTNSHGVKLLDEGMEYQQTMIPPEDAQFLATRSFQVEEIARIYRIPLFMLQNHAKDTSWGSGISEQILGFLIFTLTPWLIRWEQELCFKLLSEQERSQGMFIRHNVAALLRGDAKTRAAFYALALDPVKGWMTRNEVRALEDLNPEGDRITIETIDNTPATDPVAPQPF